MRSTLEANYKDISWGSLPATFQDAVDFTRRLGLQYIWIDSICIIQGDEADWARESSLMVGGLRSKEGIILRLSNSSG